MTTPSRHGSKPTPPDRRPYRRMSESGPEVIHEVNGPAGLRWRTTWRQLGWHGQSGAFYALGEPAPEHEPGSYSPMYVIAHVDEIDTSPDDMRTAEPARFYLQRAQDVTGASGTGRVADGVLWPDGTVTLRWRGERASVVHWNNLADAKAVHAHNGATAITWLDRPPAHVDWR